MCHFASVSSSRNDRLVGDVPLEVEADENDEHDGDDDGHDDGSDHRLVEVAVVVGLTATAADERLLRFVVICKMN
jgi:hypothetical protein